MCFWNLCRCTAHRSSLRVSFAPLNKQQNCLINIKTKWHSVLRLIRNLINTPGAYLDSSVCTWLDDWTNGRVRGQGFFITSTPTMQPYQLPIQRVPGALPGTRATWRWSTGFQNEWGYTSNPHKTISRQFGSFEISVPIHQKLHGVISKRTLTLILIDVRTTNVNTHVLSSLHTSTANNSNMSCFLSHISKHNIATQTVL